MLLFVLLKGILMGLAIAAPVGPIALLCIRRTLALGRLSGLLSGLGAATADGLYGLIAAFGLSALSDLLVKNTSYLQFIGGLFLCYLGLKTFFATSNIAESRISESTPTAPSSISSQFSLLTTYTSTLALTLANPATILSFIAIFAGLGITQTNYLGSVTLVFGVFTGSAGWWLVLISTVALLRNRLTPQQLARFNQGSSKVFGTIIFGFGAAALMVR
ncbi:MAG: LysE family transporter [Phormidesmis sp.]